MSTIKVSTFFENISSNGGSSFVSGILDSISGMSLWDKALPCHCNNRFSHQGIDRGAIGLMTAGCYDFADMEKFSGDAMSRRRRIPLRSGCAFAPCSSTSSRLAANL